MMNETKGKIYVKKITEEYNVLLQSWGHSDMWDLSQFKTLEDMIFKATKINVNANTLKRFFQQRTENPQLATKDALCQFLGYANYTDFVVKKIKEEEAHETIPNVIQNQLENNNIEDITEKYIDNSFQSGIKNTKKYVYVCTIGAMILILGYFIYTYKLKELYINHLISSIEFSASKVKGTGPLTVTFSYKIPSRLFNDISIVYEESNGDTTEKNPVKKDKVNATYIYEGEAFCFLKYQGKVIRTIHLEILKAGWSVFVREERKNFFKVLPFSQAFNPGKYASLPIDSVPVEARAGHLFVSYIFYTKDQLVDGDNFIYEARLRNSAAENAVPLSDIIMYISSDKNMHGFAMNENGYAYIKFISGEKTIKGDEYNLSRFNFNPSEWHIMKIKVVNKKTTFYVDEEEVLGMDYTESSGYANELILRFKGCGAVDYVKIFNLDGELVFEENFDQIIR